MKILQGNIRVGKKQSSRDAKGCPDQFEHLPTKFNATMKLGMAGVGRTSRSFLVCLFPTVSNEGKNELLSDSGHRIFLFID